MDKGAAVRGKGTEWVLGKVEEFTDRGPTEWWATGRTVGW